MTTITLDLPEMPSFASVRTARLVHQAIARMIEAGQMLDTCELRARELDIRLRKLIAAGATSDDPAYQAAVHDEQLCLSRVDHARRILGALS